MSKFIQLAIELTGTIMVDTMCYLHVQCLLPWCGFMEVGYGGLQRWVGQALEVDNG